MGGRRPAARRTNDDRTTVFGFSARGWQPACSATFPQRLRHYGPRSYGAGVGSIPARHRKSHTGQLTLTKVRRAGFHESRAHDASADDSHAQRHCETVVHPPPRPKSLSVWRKVRSSGRTGVQRTPFPQRWALTCLMHFVRELLHQTFPALAGITLMMSGKDLPVI